MLFAPFTTSTAPFRVKKGSRQKNVPPFEINMNLELLLVEGVQFVICSALPFAPSFFILPMLAYVRLLSHLALRVGF
jgi:hypothetical protein